MRAFAIESGSSKRRRRLAESLDLRAATLEDLDSIVSIERASFPTPWPRSAIAKDIAGRNWSRVVVATCDGDIVGYMIYWIVATELHLLNLAVDTRWKRCGVATALLEHLISTGKEGGMDEVLLEVRVSNHAAQRLYSRFGFEQLAVRRGYYSDSGEDAIVMWLLLGDTLQSG